MAKQFFSSTDRQLRENDRVKVIKEVEREQDRGVTYVVEKFAVKNVTIRPESGGRGVTLAPELLIHADEVADDTESASVFEAYQPPLSDGTVVRVSAFLARLMKIEQDTLMVVTGLDRNGHHKITFLGGDEKGRYWSKVERKHLTVIPIDQINR